MKRNLDYTKFILQLKKDILEKVQKDTSILYPSFLINDLDGFITLPIIESLKKA